MSGPAHQPPPPPLSWDGGQLEGTAWQGIRYLTLTLDLTPEAETPATVTVHLNHGAGTLRPDQVVVTGGRRIQAPAQQATIAGSTVVLRFRSIGDHSPYTVTLLDGGGRSLHPFFAAAQFTFTIDCETGDCRPAPLQAAVPRPQPPPVDLLTKDFAGFLALLTEWVRVHNPSVSDLTPASFERLLIDLLAWFTDMTSYHQDRVAAEAFIQTAAQRFSLRQQAILLGTTVDDGEAPRTVLGVDAAASGYLPAGIQVRVRTAADEIPVSFVTAERTLIRHQNSSSQLRLAAFPGAFDARLAAGSRELLLLGHGYQARAGDRLALVQGGFSQVVTLSSDPVRLTQPGWVAAPSGTFDPATDAPVPVTRVSWSEPLGQTLRPWDTPGLTLNGNIVDARYGTPRTAVAGQPGRLRRDEVPLDLGRPATVLFRSAATSVPLLRAVRVPEWPVVHEDGIPAVEVSVDTDLWTRVEHLHSSQSYDLHYVAQADEDGAVWLRFGDGVHGREVPMTASGGPAVEIRVSYRIGDPVAGNVGSGTVTQLVRPRENTDEQKAVDDLSVSRVANLAPATGGRRPQSQSQLRQRIPESLHHDVPRRAVALADYATAATQVTGVGRATARTGGGPFNAVVVLIDPEGGGDLPEDLRQQVYDHLDEVRMTGREHVVLAAEYVSLDVALLLCAEPGTAPDVLRDRVLAELRPGTQDHRGWFHPDRLSFGDTVQLSDLIAFVQGLAGVRSVTATRFGPSGDRAGPAVQDVVTLGRTKVARLDDDPDAPENGTLSVAVIGLDASGDEIVIDGQPPAPGATP